MDEKKRKVTVVGAGAVGSTFAYALAQSGYADEIAITDMNKNFAEGQALDLVQGLPFLPQVDIHAGDKADYADSDIVVVTARFAKTQCVHYHRHCKGHRGKRLQRRYADCEQSR